MNFTSTFMTLGNVLGHAPKNAISAWCDPNGRKYQLLRSAAWDAPERTAEAAGGVLLGPPLRESDKGSSSERIVDFGRTKHKQMETVSLIREPLWERARWTATLFLTSEGDSNPPALAPTFREPGPAEVIFAELFKEIGIEDTKEILRVVIIRGIDKKKPHSYRVLIGTNAKTGEAFENRKLLFLLSRVNTMVPVSHENLERFLRCYRIAGAYYLIHGVMRGTPSAAEPIWDNCILKR
jgi:hypothetical protein